MEKPAEKSQYENITVSRIYETLKSKQFLDDLWWDMLADMKEKPSYKRIKDMVERLITQTGDFCAKPIDDTQQLKRKTMLAEISILAYTIDTVISQVLYKKLQNEFQTFIIDIIDELKSSEKKRENSVVEQKNNPDSSQATENKSPTFNSKEKISSFNSIDSDEESDISVGNFSMDSVSSVHTSELSSFDDEISVSSEDEVHGKRKKKMSLKDANEKYLNGKLLEIYEASSADKHVQKKKNLALKPSTQGKKSIYIVGSPSRKTLPERLRKPNSKYSSKDIVCPIKQYSLPNKKIVSQSFSLQTNMVTENVPCGASKLQRKRRRPKRFDDDDENDNPSANTSNQYPDAATEDLTAIGAQKLVQEQQQVPSINPKSSLTPVSSSIPKSNGTSIKHRSPPTFGSRDRTAFTLFSTKR